MSSEGGQAGDMEGYIEEAGEDIMDAAALAGRAGGGPMALYHCRQSAEKYLRALAVSSGDDPPLTWDIARLYGALKDRDEALPGVLDAHVAVLAGGSVSAANALAAARGVQEAVLGMLGRDVPELDVARVVDDGSKETGQAPRAGSGEGRGGGPSDRPRGRRRGRRHGGRAPGPVVDGRPVGERKTSYVRTFLMCKYCGVRIPMKRQTARGRVPCPQCGRMMIVAK